MNLLMLSEIEKEVLSVKVYFFVEVLWKNRKIHVIVLFHERFFFFLSLLPAPANDSKLASSSASVAFYTDYFSV